MRYLFIGAHPDDLEFSCGGTIARLVDEGHEVAMVVMSCGGNSENGSTNKRRTEQMSASRLLGSRYIHIMDYEDGSIGVSAESVRRIGREFDRINPDFVITHYPNDSHQDHRNVAAIVKSATRRKCSLLYFDSYSSIDFKPNLYVDISRYTERKKEALEMFESQITKYKERGLDFIGKSLLICELNGYEGNAQYAEAFAIDTYMI